MVYSSSFGRARNSGIDSGPKIRGVLAKGVSVESGVTAKETKRKQRCWAQLYIWHSEQDIQERRIFLQKPPCKTPFSWFLIDTVTAPSGFPGELIHCCDRSQL